MKRLVLLLLATLLCASSAQGQALIPTATTSGGINPWETMQVGLTMVGSQSSISPVGGASALYLGRHVQAAYVGPATRLSDPPLRVTLLTSLGVSRLTRPPTSTDSPSSSTSVYPFSSMVGLIIQDEARALLIGVEYSPGHVPISERHRTSLRRYEHAQQRRLVVGFGWSL